MNERVVAILLAVLMVAGASLRAEELPRLNQDEIALLVASGRNYSSDEVTELLTMVITIAEEELQREEAERREVAALLESCEMEAEIRNRVERREWWLMRTIWTMVGVGITVVAQNVMM
jgi:hypothetical protein